MPPLVPETQTDLPAGKIRCGLDPLPTEPELEPVLFEPPDQPQQRQPTGDFPRKLHRRKAAAPDDHLDEQPSRCTWTTDLFATNAAFLTRGTVNMENVPDYRQIDFAQRKAASATPPARFPCAPQFKPKWTTGAGRPSNIAEADGGMWIKQSSFKFAEVPKRQAHGSPLPWAPHQVLEKDVQRTKSMQMGGRSTMSVPAPVGELEREPSLARFVGLGFSGALERKMSRVSQV